ncbi:hypothetical protein SGO26_09425 [Cupriavidus metallidurans]|uniref:hypothetical protein n=1 Tax=Cupriavidus TaxID=106589 RepID=UPI0025A69950|nr:hypothetical protein [Cupriavidus sp. TKC]GMG90267.1 hypothetical protein Cmtc_14870 [Cupriavidus sp. TKC]
MGLVGVGFGVGILLTAVLTFPPGNSGEWASWVQAIGSIGAIWGAFALGKRQATEAEAREEKNRAKRDTEALEAVLALAQQMEKFCGVALRDAHAAVQKGGEVSISIELWRSLFNPLADQLRAVPLHRPPYATAAEHAIGVVAACAYFLQHGAILNGASGKEAAETLEMLTTWYGNLLRTVNRFRKLLGREEFAGSFVRSEDGGHAQAEAKG